MKFDKAKKYNSKKRDYKKLAIMLSQETHKGTKFRHRSYLNAVIELVLHDNSGK